MVNRESIEQKGASQLRGRYSGFTNKFKISQKTKWNEMNTDMKSLNSKVLVGGVHLPVGRKGWPRRAEGRTSSHGRCRRSHIFPPNDSSQIKVSRMSAARQVVGIPMPAGSAPSPPVSRGASKGKGSFFVFHSFGVVRMPRGDRWAKKGLSSNPGEGMDISKCIIPLRHGNTLHSRPAASFIARLVEGEERAVSSIGLRAHRSAELNQIFPVSASAKETCTQGPEWASIGTAVSHQEMNAKYAFTYT
ncbi:hypothetical protein TNCV_831301 [Trichonephila clavipes]|nr:hypothetical protein TNCV_831301 [Trichonephila clavipes]